MGNIEKHSKQIHNELLYKEILKRRELNNLKKYTDKNIKEISNKIKNNKEA